MGRVKVQKSELDMNTKQIVNRINAIQLAIDDLQDLPNIEDTIVRDFLVSANVDLFRAKQELCSGVARPRRGSENGK